MLARKHFLDTLWLGYAARSPFLITTTYVVDHCGYVNDGSAAQELIANTCFLVTQLHYLDCGSAAIRGCQSNTIAVNGCRRWRCADNTVTDVESMALP